MALPIPSGSTGKSSPEYTADLIKFAVLILIITPILFTLFAPAHIDKPYEEQINELQNEYYLSTGHNVTATTEIWPLVGIYEPYTGGNYGVSEDGWIYGVKVVNYSPQQYPADTANGYSVRLMDNGLYYYTKVPANDLNHTAATYKPPAQEGQEGTWDYSNASIYSAVAMDNGHKSNVFFTADNKITTDNGYYYIYSGYRMAFAPIRAYEADNGGTALEIQPRSSSLSLIWYQYSTLSGLAGMLSINGSDQGLSYLTGDDITRAFNGATYSSVFDMTFNNLKCHLTIKLDPARISAGMSPKTAYDNGYWSVVVTSDAIASSNINNASYEFNFDNVFQTLIDLLTFDIASDYDIPGWEATIASLLVTMPLWAALISLAIANYYILIGVALLAVVQSLNSLTSWWPF